MSFDLGNIPWTFWVALGIFIGLLIGNRKFRDECDAILARMFGSKNGKKKGVADSSEIADNDDEECSICGCSGSMAVVFDNHRGICRQCLEEICKPQVSRLARR